MPLLTGGQIIYEYLKKEGVPYVAAISGHGDLALLDPFLGQDRIKIITTKHEQGAAHLADGYFRASGKPLCVFTSIGPGACNTTSAVATAFVDSSAMVIFTGSVQTYFMGRGILQEIERKHWSDFWRVLEPVVKRSWQVTRVDQLPRVLPFAFKLATGGRPGPVHIDMPLDVQAEAAEVTVPDPSAYRPSGRQRGDQEEVKKAIELLISAKRPVIIAGGGVVLSDASQELRELAEFLGAPVLTTFRGISKGVFPEDHELFAYYSGHATSIGNEVSTSADVILVVGSRLRDETMGSFKPGAVLNIPPTKIIHVDIDINEIGKNVPVDVGILGDAKSVLHDMLSVARKTARADYRKTSYFKELQEKKAKWQKVVDESVSSTPMSMGRVLKEAREFLRRDAIVVVSAGLPQEFVCRQFPMYEPRTFISSGGYSTMGFGVPASIGAKLAHPERQVLDIEGDGSFLMTGLEMHTAYQHNVPIVVLILNNYGWISIRDHELRQHGQGHVIATEFVDPKGRLYSPDFVELAHSLSCYGEKVRRPEEVQPALERAFASGKPAIVEAIVDRDYPASSPEVFGPWDLAPMPSYLHRK